MKDRLIFAYNADSGLFNTITDIAHKFFSPETYDCQLCALTHTPFGIKDEWKEFLDGLDADLEFLHRNELKEKFGIEDEKLPLILQQKEGKLIILMDADAINRIDKLSELQREVRAKI